MPISEIQEVLQPKTDQSRFPVSSDEKIPPSSSVLDNWAEKHKIEKRIETTPLVYIARAISLVVAAVFLVLALPFIAAYNFKIVLQEKYRIWAEPQSVLASIRSMKNKEETDKFQTMGSVLKDLHLDELKPKEAAIELTQHLSALLTSEEQLRAVDQQKRIRYILRDLSRQGALNPEWIEALKDPGLQMILLYRGTIDSMDFIDAIQSFNGHIEAHYPDLVKDLRKINWNDIQKAIQKRTFPQDQAAREVTKFERSLSQLLKTLKEADLSQDPANANRQLIAQLRIALKNPVYQFLKEDPTQPSIHLLHRLASDIWNKAPSLDGYHAVGKSLLHKLEKTNTDAGSMSGQELADQLKASHSTMEKNHWSDQGLSGLFYAITHPLQVMGGLASEGGIAREIPAMVGLDEYDSHGTLSNNPSLQGVTSIPWIPQDDEQIDCQINNCYGGSPTIGDHRIASEFEAAIQAAENNQFASEELRDPDIPMLVVYNNLQNLDKAHGEGPRSRTIMLLNKKFPLSFRGTTFAKDSDLYMMRKPEHVVWKNPEQFGKVLLGEFKRSFDPKEKGHGFYFHGTYAQWEALFNKAIGSADKHFKEQIKLGATLEPKDLQGAYVEYVYSLLNAANEMESLKLLIERGIKNPKIMAISACKENIDRGGMENTKYMYTRLSKDFQERLSLILGIMHSRALSSRDRVILQARMPQILNFMRITEPEQFRARLMDFYADLGYPADSLEYRPAVSA